MMAVIRSSSPSFMISWTSSRIFSALMAVTSFKDGMDWGTIFVLQNRWISLSL